MSHLCCFKLNIHIWILLLFCATQTSEPFFSFLFPGISFSLKKAHIFQYFCASVNWKDISIYLYIQYKLSENLIPPIVVHPSPTTHLGDQLQWYLGAALSPEQLPACICCAWNGSWRVLPQLDLGLPASAAPCGCAPGSCCSWSPTQLSASMDAE